MQHKEAITIEEQIAKMQERKIQIADIDKAKEILLDIGYYRLGHYFSPFEKGYPKLKIRAHNYTDGVQFSDAVRLYYFDFDLRIILLRYTSRIEIAFRTYLTYVLSIKYKSNNNWFVDENFVDKNFVDYFKSTIYENIKKKPAIIKHHKKYKKVDFAPAWKTLEYLTLGEVLTLYKNLKSTDDKLDICRHFGIKMTDVFENYIETIRILRNDCAHGSPLFELKLNKSVRKGPAYNDIPQNSQSLKAALDVIHYFINAISPNRAKDLKDEIAKIQNDIKSKNPQLVPILNKSTKMRF